MQGVAVRVVNAARFEHFAGHGEFIAGAKQGHAQTAENVQFGCADRSGQAEMRRTQACAGGDDFRTRRNVLAAAAYGLIAMRHDIDDDIITLMRTQLLHHHGVSTRRHRRAGEDACGSTRCQRMADTACGNALCDAQARAGGGHVGATHGIAIHRAVIQRRHGDGGYQRSRQHAAARRLCRQGFAVGNGSGGCQQAA